MYNRTMLYFSHVQWSIIFWYLNIAHSFTHTPYSVMAGIRTHLTFVRRTRVTSTDVIHVVAGLRILSLCRAHFSSAMRVHLSA